MKSIERLSRIDRLVAEESGSSLRWWYISYASEDAFLGGCFVFARGHVSAVRLACDLGISPGGSARSYSITQDPPPAEKYRNKLLTREEIDEEMGLTKRGRK